MSAGRPSLNDPYGLSRVIARLLQEAVAAALHGTRNDRNEIPALTIEPAAQPMAPRLLARAHPGGPQARIASQVLYERCLKHYREVVRAEDRALMYRDDLGAAMAYFVAATMYALTRKHITPPMVLRVERQLRAAVAGSAHWMASTTRQKQTLFEQFAILGVLISGTAPTAHRPGATAARNACRRHLLGLESLGINEQHGLHLTEATAA